MAQPVFSVEGYSTREADGSYTHYIVAKPIQYGDNKSIPVRIDIHCIKREELEVLGVKFQKGDSYVHKQN